MRFGERLYKKRKSLGLSAEDLSKKSGISRSYVTLMENGKRMPGKKVIPRLAEALNIKVVDIVNWYLEEMREKLM